MVAAFADKLEAAGISVTGTAEGLEVSRGNGRIRPVDVETAPFPGFPTDLQPFALTHDAVADGRPVLALESTIFTHGLPRPRNVEVALEAETDVEVAEDCPSASGEELPQAARASGSARAAAVTTSLNVEPGGSRSPAIARLKSGSSGSSTSSW